MWVFIVSYKVSINYLLHQYKISKPLFFGLSWSFSCRSWCWSCCMVSWSWVVPWSWCRWVGSYSFVCDICDISTSGIINMIVDNLGTTIGKSNTVGSGCLVTVTGFVGSKVSMAVVISNSVFKSIYWWGSWPIDIWSWGRGVIWSWVGNNWGWVGNLYSCWVSYYWVMDDWVMDNWVMNKSMMSQWMMKSMWMSN